MNKIIMINKVALLIMALLLTHSISSSAASWHWGHQWDEYENSNRRLWSYFYKKNRPDNLAKAMTFTSTRAFDSVDGTFFLDGLIGGDGMRFFKTVMGYSDEEIEQNREQAREFFMHRFGLDTSDPRLYHTGFEIDPAADYRVIMATGENHKIGKGYPILDGGWGLVVVDPQGIDLGGEFDGTHVPAGTMFVYGNYLIKRGKGRKDLVIDYQSRGPILRVGTGSVVNCEVFHPKLGPGVSWGYSELHNLSNGQVAAQVRNVLTFPKFGYEQKLIEN